jgi:hypothetical protein
MDKEIEQLNKELVQLSGKDGELDSARQSALAALGQYRQHRDRSFIVRCVVWLYVGSIGSIGLLLLYRGLWSADQAAFSNLSEVVKIAVIPVVTLVIGYYFGSSKSD